MHNLVSTIAFGGLLKNSLIDYPGVVACVVFTSGCNLCCPYCHNPELAAPCSATQDSLVRPEEITAFLEKRKGMLDGVVITGGEPTLHPGLESFCSLVKSMGYRVKLDTNGSRPGVVASLLKKRLVDYVAMDIKTRVRDYGRLANSGFNPSWIMETIAVIMAEAPAYEFRSTCVRPFIDKEVMPDIREMIQGASHYILQQCSDRGTMLNPGALDIPGDFLTQSEIKELKLLAEPWVERCSVR